MSAALEVPQWGSQDRGGKAAIVEEEAMVVRLGIDELPCPGSTSDGGEGKPMVEVSSPMKARLRMIAVEGDSVANTLVVKVVLQEPTAGDGEGEGAGQLLLQSFFAVWRRLSSPGSRRKVTWMMPMKSSIVSNELPCCNSCNGDELPSIEPKHELSAGGIGGHVDEGVDSMS